MEELESDKHKSATGFQHTYKPSKLGLVAVHTGAEEVDNTDTWCCDTDADDAGTVKVKLPSQRPSNANHVEAAVL